MVLHDNYIDDAIDELFKTIALENSKLKKFCFFLRDKFEIVKNASFSIDLQYYPLNCCWCYEIYIEATISKDRVICWSFEVSRFDNQWLIRTQIEESHGDVIKSFEDRHASNHKDLKQEITNAISELTSHYEFLSTI